MYTYMKGIAKIWLVSMAICALVVQMTNEGFNNNNRDDVRKSVRYTNNVYKQEKKMVASTNVATDNIHAGETTQLLQSNADDNNYSGQKVLLNESDRGIVEQIVMGETSGKTFPSAALVAQAIRDAMVTDGLTAQQVRVKFRYTNRNVVSNETVKDAVKYIFDDGKYIVKHRVMYFYAPAVSRSSWHERQQFIVEYGGHRVFDRKY